MPGLHQPAPSLLCLLHAEHTRIRAKAEYWSPCAPKTSQLKFAPKEIMHAKLSNEPNFGALLVHSLIPSERSSAAHCAI